MKNTLLVIIYNFSLMMSFIVITVHSSLSQSDCASLVKDIGKGSIGGLIGSITPINDKIALFFAADEFYGRELWRTDGTAKGTYLVKDIYPGLRGSRFDPYYDDYRIKPVVFNGIMYFTSFTNISGTSIQVWRSDGTESGTYPITDNPSGISFRYPQLYKNVIYFWSSDGLYRTEGTKESTKLVKVVKNQHEIKGLVEMNGVFWFTTSDYIWQTDGSEEGTIPVIPFKYLSAPKLSVINNKLFFRADQPLTSTLWQSDGTIDGTKIVREAVAGSWSNIWSAKNIAYFIGNESTLWRSDGTLQGTYQLTTTSPRQIFVYKDELYFTLPIARSNTQKGQIWKSDGTINGTRAIIDLTPEIDAYSFPINISEQNGVLYFYSDAGSTVSSSIDLSLKRQRSGFWRSDGTSNGTKLICPLNNNLLKIVPTPVYNDPFYYYTVEYNNAPANILMNGYALFIGDEFESNGGRTNKYGAELYRLELINCPKINVNIVGDSTFCLGKTTILSSSVTGGNSPYSYTWQRETTDLSATTSNLIVGTAGNYGVIITDANGCKGMSNVKVLQNPALSINSPATASFCVGQTAILSVTVSNGKSPYIYQWQLNGNVIPNASSNSFNAGTAGNYSVSITDSKGCAGTSANYTVTQKPSPNITITKSGSTDLLPNSTVLLSVPISAGQTYQWNKNGVAISGATNNSYTINSAGSYTVTVIGNGCSATSEAVIAKLVTAIEEEPNPSEIQVEVSPNPTQEVCGVKIDLLKPSKVILQLRDMSGKSLKEQTLSNPNNHHETTLDFSNYPAGIYLLQVIVDGKIVVMKVVRQ
jgi:ELWxxDGT repeat protein